MPVTIQTARHAPRVWKTAKASTVADLLHGADRTYSGKEQIFQSSFSKQLRESHVSPSHNGLVWAAYHAYSTHHRLIIRPEDVWFAILSQLGFYINAHAEELRSHFVAHQGKEELIVYATGTIFDVDFESITQQMAGKIQDKVKDPELEAWIMPDFSTTTSSDCAVAAILMMGAMQKYFDYGCCLDCGIPSVTLLGEREDWQNILNRLDKLSEFGDEPTTFAELLRPVMHNFIAAFDSKPDPDESILPSSNTSTPKRSGTKSSRWNFWSKKLRPIQSGSVEPTPGELISNEPALNEAVVNFWSKIADWRSNGSGPDYLSGWITAFCMWDSDGQSLRGMPSRQDFALTLEGITYHQVDIGEVPCGFTSVPVWVDDNGRMYYTEMVAGSMGIQASSSGRLTDGGGSHGIIRGDMVNSKYVPSRGTEEPGLDSLQPVAGWVMYETKGK